MTEPTRRRRAVAPAPEEQQPTAVQPAEPDPWGLGIESSEAPAAPAVAMAPPRVSARARREDARDVDQAMRIGGIEKSASEMRGGATQLRKTVPDAERVSASDGFERITTRVFDLPNPEAEFDELERALKLGVQAYDAIAIAVDSAEDNARRAHKLYVCARADAERFNIDATIVEAAMRTEALAELQRERDSGTRTKQITDSDIASKIAAMFPDEHRDLAEKRIKNRKMIEHLEAFAGLWRSRCYTLAKILESKR